MGEERRSGGVKWEVAALVLAGGAVGLALANRLSELSAGQPSNALTGETGRYAWTLGDVHYTVKGAGEPLVLIHGVYAGASSYEYRRVFDLLAQHFRVYAFDLLGFGLSDRPPVVYSPVLYEELIADFVRQVVGGADHPVKVIASTLGAAFTIRTAAERPGLFERLVFIEPTGYEELASAGDTPLRRAALALLRSPLLGQAIYNLAASRPSIRYFLKSQTYANPAAVSDDMVDHYYSMAHQPGARYAAASFLSGMLNSPVGSMYPLLKQPILLCWGKDAKFTPLENARLFRQSNLGAELRVFDCGGMPQDELPAEFLHDVTAWLKAPIPSPRRG
jgi:pimeloyl-ACP methyl ester carboxylesterase